MQRQWVVPFAVSWLIAGFVPAQDFAGSLELAQECIAAKEWKEAFEILIGLKDKASTDEERAQVAQRLSDLGLGLHGESLYAEALRALEHALVQFRRLHGDRDHPDVATSLNSVAQCLQSLGRAGEALARLEQALVVIERLRDETRIAGELRQSFFEELRRSSTFEQFQ